jgi:hypothetical protein
MPELRKLDLQFALEAARALRKDIENQARSVEDAAAQFLLEIAFLARTQGGRRDHQLSIIFREQRSQFVELSLPDEIAGIRSTTRTDQFTRYHSTRGTGQFGKLLTFRFVR